MTVDSIIDGLKKSKYFEKNLQNFQVWTKAGASALESYHEQLLNEMPKKCHGCECAELDFVNDDWVAKCSEDVCYQDD